ncbi:UNVERIFIED_CONTAM: hypothetical protein Sangu_0074200 [Sesamum angustifolium]|uniref:Uncharacterized protein n=1 Tax=Sesamum angustifolium TaxID=2727405 RepID=A0AAW2RJC7_9LAMI
MFDGVPSDQFHQFLVSRTSSLPIPLSFAAAAAYNDPYASLHSPTLQQQHHQHQESPTRSIFMTGSMPRAPPRP